MEFTHTLRDLMRVRLTKFAAVVLGATIMIAALAPWVAPHDPVKFKPWDSLHPPSSTYWLGADRLGRDQLSRLIYGARVSLVIGIGGVGIAMCLGMSIGVTAGWYGGMWDEGSCGSWMGSLPSPVCCLRCRSSLSPAAP